MKKNTLLIYFSFFCFAFIYNSNAQQFQVTPSQQNDFITEDNAKFLQENGVVRCYSVENEIALKKQFPERYNDQQFENWLQPKINQYKKDIASSRILPPTFNIPVVIHIVHNGDAIGTGENISDAQALSQITVLQEDFRRTGTRGSTNSTGVAVDSEINFCAAKIDPNGNATNGVVRHGIVPPTNNFAPTGDWETRTDIRALQATRQWDPTKYLNIWVFRFGGDTIPNGGLQNLLGFAQFPSASTLVGLNGPNTATSDGVVLSFSATGSKDYETVPNSFLFNGGNRFIYGRTGTHEVGHWLGLRHTWGDGDCSVDDFCADTPTTATSTSGCPVGNDTCPASPGVDMYQNYMDYSNDICLDTFTQDQKDRMITVLRNSPRRKELTQSNVCDAVTTPTVSFTTTTNNQVVEGTGCDFTDYTFNLSMNTGGSSTTTANFIVEETSATQGVDFELMNNSVTFNTGSTSATGSGVITLRVFKDGIVENDEYLKLAINTTTSGNTVATTAKFVLYITNDDFESINTTVKTILDDDGTNFGNFDTFSSNAAVPTRWTTLQSVAINTPGSLSGRWYGSQANLANNSDFIIAPVSVFSDNITEIKITSAIFTVNSATLSTYGLFFFNSATNQLTQIITGTAPGYNGSNLPQDNPRTQFVITDATNLNNIKGKTGAFAIRHSTPTATGGYLAWDTIDIVVTNTIDVQTTVNTGSGEFSTPLAQIGTTYPKDTATNNAIANIETTTAFDYGCTTVAVSRAGTGAQNQDGTQVSDKTFTITSAHDTAASSTITFFFTKAELEGWEAASGESRTNLGIKRIGSSQETVAATVSPYGTGDDFKISGTFTGGIQGTYYFGQRSSLSVAKNEFNNFSLFPNPATNEVNIAFDTNNNVNLSLFDIRGRNVLSSNKVNNSNRFETKLDVSNISSGIYLLNITSGDINVTKKIIIN